MLELRAYLLVILLLFLVITVKAVGELMYQEKIKKFAGVLLCYPIYMGVICYLIMRF